MASCGLQCPHSLNNYGWSLSAISLAFPEFLVTCNKNATK